MGIIMDNCSWTRPCRGCPGKLLALIAAIMSCVWLAGLSGCWSFLGSPPRATSGLGGDRLGGGAQRRPGLTLPPRAPWVTSILAGGRWRVRG